MEYTSQHALGLVALAILGFGLVSVYAIEVFFRLNMNAQAFMNQIKKLVRAGRTEMAVKLCKVAPNALVAQAVAAVLEAWLEGRRESESLWGAVRRIDLDGPLKKARFNGALGVLMVGAALAGAKVIGLGGGYLTVVGIAGGLGLLLAFGSHRTAKRIVRAVPECVHQSIELLYEDSEAEKV